MVYDPRTAPPATPGYVDPYSQGRAPPSYIASAGYPVNSGPMTPPAQAGLFGPEQSAAQQIAGGAGLPAGWQNQFAPAPPMAPGALSGPGVGEQAYDQFGSGFFDPGRTEQLAGQGLFDEPGQREQYWNQVMGRFTGTEPTSNRAEEAYQAYQSGRPDFQKEPGYGAYYEDAATRLQNRMDKTSAARGSYGSSVALGLQGDALAGLEADRARTEADYGLRRLGEERAWMGLGGELGRGADISSLAGSQNELSYLTGGAGIAGGAAGDELARQGLAVTAATAADGAELNRLAAGMNAAGMAQKLEEARMSGQLDNLIKVGSMLAGMSQEAYTAMIERELGLASGTLSGGIAGASSALNQGNFEQQSATAGLGDVGQFLSGGTAAGLF